LLWFGGWRRASRGVFLFGGGEMYSPHFLKSKKGKGGGGPYATPTKGPMKILFFENKKGTRLGTFIRTTLRTLLRTRLGVVCHSITIISHFVKRKGRKKSLKKKKNM